MNIKNFKGSNGWADRFKKRHDLEFKSISGEVKSADISQLENFREILKEKLKIYHPVMFLIAMKRDFNLRIQQKKVMFYKKMIVEELSKKKKE